MTGHHVSKVLILLGMALFSKISAAESLGIFSIVESKPISELWLNPGFYSYHSQKNKGYNNRNFGLGENTAFRLQVHLRLAYLKTAIDKLRTMLVGIGNRLDWVLFVLERLLEL